MYSKSYWTMQRRKVWLLMRLSASWSNENTNWTNDMENYSEDTEANKSKKQSRRSDIVKRMMSAYKKKKRADKIKKLAADDQHWSGLSWQGTSKTRVCLPPYFGSQSINLYPRARVLILGFKKIRQEKDIKESHGSIRSINLPSPSTILNLLPVAFDLALADL